MGEWVGKPVVLHSLASRPELNGRSGMIKSFDAHRGRAGVHVKGEPLLAIKLGNLALRGGEAAPVEIDMERLVAIVKKVCMQNGSGWQSAKAIHAKLQESSEWADVTFGQVKAACAIIGRSDAVEQERHTPAPESVPSVLSSESERSKTSNETIEYLEVRVSTILETLRAAKPGSEERRGNVVELYDILKEHGSKRGVVNALIDGEGPQILYAIENSMQGDWKTDARNGTLTKVGEIMRLPGPAGLAVAQYCTMTSKRIQAAAKGKHDGCEH